LLCRTQSSLAVKAYILSVAAFLTVIVGISRVYLGVHWPTDVIAGMIVGAVWLGATMFAFRGAPSAPRETGPA
jgi:undecaprenyl-diphosphatase